MILELGFWEPFKWNSKSQRLCKMSPFSINREEIHKSIEGRNIVQINNINNLFTTVSFEIFQELKSFQAWFSQKQEGIICAEW